MHPRWWPIFQQPTSYQLIVHGSLKHLLNLSPLLHLYSLSQSQDFSPGFPQIPPASLVSNFISLLVILYLMPAWTWTHEDLSTPLPFFKRSSLPGCLLLSLTTYFKFLSDPFYDALRCSIASLTKYNIPSRKYIMISLFYLCSLDCGEVPCIPRLNRHYICWVYTCQN